jgi:CubicO group peptidase (beta-lactamase class C family)
MRTAPQLRRRIPRTALTILTLGAAVSAAAHRLSAVEFDSAKLALIRGKMQEFVDQRHFAGAVTIVGTREKIVHCEAVGSRDLDASQPMAANCLFRIASMTKPITAIGIMILADEGKLLVDDPVQKYLPEFRGQMLVASRTADQITLQKPSRPITIRDLLTHTSGLPGYPEGLSDLYTKRERTLAEGVLAISQQSLQFEPGSKWAYCNPGVDTLGRLIEISSGQSYESFLKDRVFTPLGMVDTTFYPTADQLARVATTYARTDERLVAAGNSIIGPTATARFPIPAGGLYSTGADLARLYQLMLGRGVTGQHRILSEAGVAAMTKVQTGDLPCGFVTGMSFGFGWAVVRQPEGVTSMLSPGTFGHGGAFGTQGWIDPQRGVFYILLFQRVGLPNGDASDMRREFQTLAAGAIQ